MSQHAILNPHPTSPLNPDYGWQKKRPVTHVVAKASMGPAYFREMTDMGHQFVLNWGTTVDNAKMPSDVEQLKYFYEQYRDGFFTLIDHEGGGRHYVGRFTTPVEPIPVSYNHWSVQGVTFEEVPTAPMLRYPGNWQYDAIWRYCISDFGELKVALTPTADWSIETTGLALNGVDLVSVGTAGDQATMSYVGYGFQFWARSGYTSGVAALYLDGVLVTTLDQYAPGAPASAMMWQQLNVPLGLHTVGLLALHTKNAASAGYYVVWDALKVMR